MRNGRLKGGGSKGVLRLTARRRARLKLNKSGGKNKATEQEEELKEGSAETEEQT